MRLLIFVPFFIFVLLFFGTPEIYAEMSGEIMLSEANTKLFLKGIQGELTEYGILNLSVLQPEEQVAIFLARDAARKAVFDFLPVFITTETIKSVISVANFAKKLPELTLRNLLSEFETRTVQEAIKIGTDWLFQNEVKVSSGNITGSYLSYWGGQFESEFQYVMTYIENSEKLGDLIFEFYSADPIDPPARSSIGFPWELGDWLKKNKKKLDPFIVHAEFKMEKYALGWTADLVKGTPIRVSFPDKVPVLKLAKELPYPLEEQKIKLLNYLNTAKRIFDVLQSIGSEVLGKTADFAHKAKETVKGVIIRTSQLLSRGGAGLVADPFSKESQQIAFIESQLNLVKESLDAKEAEVKLNLIKDEVKLNQTKDESKPVENLAGLSFPQEQPILDSVKEEQKLISVVEVSLDSVKDSQSQSQNQTKSDLVIDQTKEAELSQAKDESVQDTQARPVAWCAIDPVWGPALSTVMFSEIAWMGSVNSANDEWMKMKNISNGEVNLEGWQLQDADNQIQVSFDKGHFISSQGVFVLERTNDDSLPGTQAHMIYTGALNNTNEALYLFDENCVLQDKVVASPDWPAGNNTSRKPMKRDNDLSWYTQGGSGGSLNAVSVPIAESPPPTVYPKILISEVQTAGVSSQIEEFVELYNPTQGQVSLTDWYVQKKTQGGDSFSTFASKNILSGKIIQASGYFLIAREGSSFASSADAVTSYPLGDNNTLALKNPNGEIVDKIGWGDVQDAENTPAPNPQAGQSLNRIWDIPNQTYYDRDNNAIDFTVHNPTSPKAKNIEDAPPPPADTTAPTSVVDLSASNPTASSIQLTWTAPGDDDSIGTAATYDLRYSISSITDANWASAVAIAGEPTPSTAGSNESMTVSGLSPGTTYFFALKSSDEVPNVAELSNIPSLATTALPSPPPPAQDTTPPQATFSSLAAAQTNVYFSLSWDATDPAGDVSPSGLQSIFLEYTVTPSVTGVFVYYDNNGVRTDWQAGSAGKITLSAQTASLSLRAQDGISYTFQVSASDVAGNESAVNSASTTVGLARTVVINEIAWSGTKAQSTDEWLELLNTTSSPVDVTGWKITSSDGVGPEITLSGTIAANSFYLIERTDEQATTAAAQLTASFGNGLSNTVCETLSLYNAENAVVDQTVCADGGAWPAGTASPDYISMERIISANAGSSVSNWASNNLIKYNGKDADNNWINGTPGQTNSTATSPTTIAELRFAEFDTLTLTLLGSPYITTAGIVSITVPAGKILVIEPGVTVKFVDNRGRLTVQGTLKAQGTQASGITFTVTDGGAIWCGIKIAQTSTDSQLDYVTIDKAQSTGSSFCNESVNYAMYVDTSVVAINNSVIQTGAYHRKLYLKNSNSTINATTVSGATLNAESVGIYVDGGSPTISNSTISNNSIGIFVNSLSNNPTIQNNTFTGNTQAVKLSSASAALSGNTATSNTYNGILFEGAVLSNMTWQADAIPYIVNKFTVNVGATLTMQEGAVIKFINSPYTDSAITVQGTLVAQGTQANPVVFTAASDNTVGGSNSYTGGGIKTSWERIYIAPGSTGSQLTYTTLKYGGNTYYEAALYVQQSDVQLSNVIISNSAQSAIYSSSGTITGSNVTLSSNAYGFHIAGACPALSAITVTGTLLHPSSAVCSF